MRYEVKIQPFGNGKIESLVDMVGSDYLHDDPLTDIRTNLFRQVLDTQDTQARRALEELGWTPPRPVPLMGAKCIVKGCLNYQGQGRFIGEVCAPCHHMLTTGEGAYNNTFVGDLYHKAAQLERFKTQLRELTKETTK